ncbi:hypothetical protein DFQ30_001689, partial [Apophysomyces sp. BC1015]
MNDAPELRNVLLYARKVWFFGYKDNWSEMPTLPTSQYRALVVEQMAGELDVALRQCALSNSVNHIRVLLRNKAQRPTGWPSEEAFPLYLLYEATSDRYSEDPALVEVKKVVQKLSPTIRRSISAFVTQLKKMICRATTEGKSVSVDDISAELRRKATVPNDWPEHNVFAEYIFARAWHVPLDISKTEESIVDIEGYNDLQLLVDQAKDAVKTDIEDFICKYRRSLEAILHRDI